MLNYILQIILFQALFFLVYEFFLKKETFFTGNRIYLIATQALVLVLPLLKFPQIQEKIPATYKEVYTQTYLTISQISTPLSNSEKEFQFRWEWLLYIGAFISLILFSIKLFNIFKTIQQNVISKNQKFSIVNINDDSTAFSFLNFIFLGEGILIEKKQEIISHELVHIKQKHSFDLLFFEILRIAFWFNPFIYLYQKRITEVHEFLVDQELSKSLTEKKQYYQTILAEVFQTEDLSFSSSFYNPSLIKKRIRMLTKNKSKNQSLLKYVLVAPLCLLSVIYVACSESSINEVPEEKNTLSNDNSNLTFDYSKWKSINYKTGDVPTCLEFVQKFDFKIDNTLLINNAGNTEDALVKLVKINNDKSESDARIVYIKHNEKTTLYNIPLARYYVKIAYGKDWKETIKNGVCTGRFTKNTSFEKGRDIIDFLPIKMESGFFNPSYELTLDYTKTKK